MTGTYGRWLTAPTPGALARTSNNVVYKFLNIITNSIPTLKRQTLLPVLNHLFSLKDFAGEDWSQFSELAGDVALEARLDGRLIMSASNGFAGLDKLPSAAALDILKRHPTSQLTMVNLWNSQPSSLVKSFAENAFRAYIAAVNIDIVQTLLDTGLVDANKAVCRHSGERYTPLEYAAINQSFKVLKHLVDRKVDVNKSLSRTSHRDVLSLLLFCAKDRRSTLDCAFLSSVKALLEARITVPTDSIETLFSFTDSRLGFYFIDSLLILSPQQLFSQYRLLIRIITRYGEDNATKIISSIIGKWRELGRAGLLSCNNLGISNTVIWCREEGYKTLAKILEPYKKDSDEIDRIIKEKYPSFEEEEGSKRFISALESRDHDRLRSLEQNGVLDDLRGQRLGQVLIKALEAGNLEYATKISNLDPNFEFCED